MKRNAAIVKIQVNGQPREVSEQVSLLALLEQLEVNRAHVAVELNGQLVPRERHGQHDLAAEDRIEIVTLVGGG